MDSLRECADGELSVSACSVTWIIDVSYYSSSNVLATFLITPGNHERCHG